MGRLTTFKLYSIMVIKGNTNINNSRKDNYPVDILLFNKEKVCINGPLHRGYLSEDGKTMISYDIAIAIRNNMNYIPNYGYLQLSYVGEENIL